MLAQRAFLRVRLGDRPALVDGPGADQLAGQIRPRVELHLVAGADLRPVLVHHLADQLRIDGAHHLRAPRPQADVGVRLAAQAALAVAVVGQAAADPVGADAREPQARAVASAAGAAQRLEAHACVAARIGHAGTGQVAQRVAGTLLQRHAKNVARSFARAQRLEQAGVGHDAVLVADALRARVAARGRLAARLALGALVARHRLARVP